MQTVCATFAKTTNWFLLSAFRPQIMNWETQEIITKTKDNGTPEAMPEAVKMEVLKRAKGCSASSPLTGIINRFSDDLPGVIAQL